MSRVLGRFVKLVDSGWKMYPVGVLFGLGFDTATEVALLFLAAGAASGGLPFYAILCLPLLFAAGMSLCDTLDGVLMSAAYGWGLTRPARRVFYNLVITGLSVAVALAVGSVEIGALIAQRLGGHGVWAVLARINLNVVGLLIAAMFLVTWVLAMIVWRVARIEER